MGVRETLLLQGSFLGFKAKECYKSSINTSVHHFGSMGKAVFVGPVFFERSPSQDAGSNKDDVGRYRGKSDTAATMEGGDVVQALPETVHDRIETRQEYVTSVTDS